jgi:signal transduction histidine kinase
MQAGSPPLRWPLDLWRAFQGPLLLAAAYFVGAEIAFAIGTLSDKIFAPFWPPNVILLCALLLAPERRWWVYIAAAAPAHMIAEFGIGMPAAQMLLAFATNCGVALLNALTVRRLVGHAPWFGDLRTLAAYIVVTAGLAPAAVAFAGAFVPILGGGAIEKYWLFWTYWYAANALSSLTIGPVLLTWMEKDPSVSVPYSWRKAREAAALTVILIVVCTFAFKARAGASGGFLPAILYSPVPVVLWAAFRFGTRGASVAILIVTVVLIGRTLKGPSVFITADAETNVLALQIFLTGLSLPLLLLSVAIDELRHTGQTMRALTGSVLIAQDEERRRIARELHDTTGQNLIAAGMMVSRIRQMASDSVAPPLAQLEALVGQSLEELRTMSYLLHPPLLDEVGLDAALEHFVDGLSQRSGLTIDLDMSVKMERLRPEVELTLFRVVQEALTNVVRHSGSKIARIRLECGISHGRHSAVLTVEDAGAGMPWATAPVRLGAQSKSMPLGGMGFVSMRERLHQVGGWLEVESWLGGTKVRAVVPDAGRVRDAGGGSSRSK